MKGWFEIFSGRYLNFILKNAWFVIADVLLFVLLSGSGIFRLSIDSDQLHFFARNSSIANLQYHINDEFKVSEPVIIMIELGNVFTYENISLIRTLSLKIKEIDEVNQVLSLTEIDDIKSTSEGITIGKLFPPKIPQDMRIINGISNYVMGLEKYNGTIVSADGKYATLIITPQPYAKSDLVAKKIKEIVTDYINHNRKDIKVYFAGSPALMFSITKIVIGDISFLIILVSFVIILALFVSFRHPYGTFLPLITVFLATVSSMGIMGYLGFPLTPIGIAIPVVMMAIGNAYGIYIVNEYHEKSTEWREKRDIVYHSVKRLLIPITMSGLTVFAGFMSLVSASGIKAIIDFAIVNAIGVVLSFIFTLSFMPAMLMILPLAKIRFKSQDLEKESRSLRKIAIFIEKNKIPVFIFVLIFACINIYSTASIKTDSDYMKYFDKNSEPRIVAEKVSDVFHGTGELILFFKGDVNDPDVLRTLTIIEEEARFHSGSKSTANSIVDIIATLNANMTQVKRIPDRKDEINNLWFFIEGNSQVSKMVNSSKTEFTSSFLLPFLPTDIRHVILAEIDNDIKTYSKISYVKTSKNLIPAARLASIMLYNRLVRANYNVSFESVENVVSNIAAGLTPLQLYSFRVSYESQRSWLGKSIKTIRADLLDSSSKISSEDLDYSLSPLTWDMIPVPDKNGTNIFKETGISGIIKLFSDMDKIILDNQITSIITAVFIVIALVAFMFRSVLTGILSITTVVFTIIVNFGIMGIIGIRLNFATATLASISIGAGIDYTIQYMARYFHEIAFSNLPPSSAFIKTVSTTGRAILSNAIAVGFAFSVLVFSHIVPLRDFGAQMFITMITSSLATITLMPIVLMFFAKKIHPKIFE
jgi:hypothetical protein